MDGNIQGGKLKKVLVIAYSFPPVGGGRVMRVVKFCKYLSMFGWHPVILTVKNPAVPDYDYGLLEEISGKFTIVRTPSLEPTFLNKYFKKHKLKTQATEHASQPAKKAVYKLLMLLKQFIFFPDTRIGWLPFCVVYGLRTIKREKIDMIFATGEPFSSFISAAILKKISRKPLVLDFRDEWTGFSQYYFPEKISFIRHIEKVVERFVVKNADRVVSVTQPIVQNFKDNYRDQDSAKFICITNGYDPDDFKRPRRSGGNNGEFVITYAGSLYKRRTPEYFLSAVKKNIRNEPDFKYRARIVILGSVENDVMDLFRDNEISPLVDLKGFVPFRESIDIIGNSNLLLYIEDQVSISNRVLPAKLFEYMATGVPIMALANDGCVKEVIDYTGCGSVSPSHDVDAITKNLASFYKDFKDNRDFCGTSKERIKEYSRQNITAKLAKTFDEVIDANY